MYASTTFGDRSSSDVFVSNTKIVNVDSSLMAFVLAALCDSRSGYNVSRLAQVLLFSGPLQAFQLAVTAEQ